MRLPEGQAVTLEWGVRESYVRYVAALPDSDITAREQATESVVRGPAGRGPWIFPAADEGTGPDGGGTWRFRGDLRFRGHGGMMFVMILDPWITLTDSGAELSVVDVAKWPDTSSRMTVARSPRGASLTSPASPGRQSIPLELAIDGCLLFDNIYPPGTVMAPAYVDCIAKDPGRGNEPTPRGAAS